MGIKIFKSVPGNCSGHCKVRTTTSHIALLSLVLPHFFTSQYPWLDDDLSEDRVDFSLVVVHPVTCTIPGIWQVWKNWTGHKNKASSVLGILGNWLSENHVSGFPLLLLCTKWLRWAIKPSGILTKVYIILYMLSLYLYEFNKIRIMNRSVSPSGKKKKSSIKKSWLTRQTSQGVITVKPSLSTPLTHTWLITGKSPQSLTFSGRTLLTMSGYSIFPFGKQMNKTPPFILTIYNLIARTLSSTMGLSNYIICMSDLLHLLISYVLQKLWIVLIFSMLF